MSQDKQDKTFESESKRVINDSPTEQTICFQQFIKDCTTENVRTAYERFMAGSKIKNDKGEEISIKPDDETINSVNQVIYDMYKELEDRTKSNLAIVSFEYTTKHEKVIHDFFTDIMSGKKYDDAYRSSLQSIERDPELSKDVSFYENFKKTLDRMKPAKKDIKSTSIRPKDGLLFDLDFKTKMTVDGTVDKDLVKETLINTLLQLYKTHLPKNENITKEEVNVDIECIRVTGKTPLSLRLAFDDTQEISSMSSKKALEAHKAVIDLTQNKETYSYNPAKHNKEIDESVKSSFVQFMNSPKKSKTERVDIIRDLIMQTSAEQDPYIREKIYDKALATSKKLSPIERLKEQGVEIDKNNRKHDELSDVISKNRDTIIQGLDLNTATNLMQSAYESVIRWNSETGSSLNHERDVIQAETDFLLKGIKSASVKESIYEIAEKRTLFITSNVYCQKIQEIIQEAKLAKKKGANNEKASEQHEGDIGYQAYEPPHVFFDDPDESKNKKKSGFSMN